MKIFTLLNKRFWNIKSGYLTKLITIIEYLGEKRIPFE